MPHVSFETALKSVVVTALLTTFACAQNADYAIGHAVSNDKSQVPLIVLTDSAADIEAAIAPEKGGELSGLKVRYNGEWIETIYLARDYAPRDDWTGKAPFLWPATGRNFPPDLEAKRKAGERFDGGAWDHNGKRYTMPIHGFARDFAWKVEAARATAEDAQVRLSFGDNEQTRRWYPFGFDLSVEYILKSGRLQIAYTVVTDADNSEAMPFSIGNHITFISPLLPNSDPLKMRLITPSTTELLKTTYGVPTGESRARSLASGVELGDFERMSAVSLTGYSGKPTLEYRDPAGLAIRLSHHGSQTPPQPVILFNVWGDAAGGFMSPEPWVGLQNSLVRDEGLVRLPAGESFKWTIELEIVRN